MKTTILSNKELDSLLMSDVWTREDLFPYRKFSKEVISVFMNILAGHLEISAKQARFLANEQAEISVAVFCDTLFRLHKQGRLAGAGNKNEPEIQEFILRCVGLHPGLSRKFRASLCNLIIESYGGCHIDETNITEPTEVRIEDVLRKENILDNEMGKTDYYLNKYSKWLSRRIRTIVMDGIRPNLKMPRIAIMYPEYFDRSLMSPCIKWVPIKSDESISDLVVEPNKRQELYIQLLEKFKMAIENMEFPLIVAEGLKRKLFDILFAVFIVLAPANILDRVKLRERLKLLKSRLDEMKVGALISKGTYGNGMLAAAAVGAKLQVISMQMGGGFGILDLVDGFYEMQLNHFDHYFGLGWKRDTIGLTAAGKTELHAFSDPGLFELSEKGRNHRIRANRGKILFSPFVHSFLYRTELWHAIYPENSLRMRMEMEKFFALFGLQDPEYNNYKIYVKLKAFSYIMYKEYEYLFGMINYPFGTRIRFLTKGVAQEYFSNVQLHLTDSLCTGFMCSLVYNLPTVAYWDRKTQTLTPQAEPVFKELNKLGVLACSAEEMAESAKKFMHYPEEWDRRELQTARQAYVDGFAKSGSDWEKEFSFALNKILKKGVN